MSLKRYWWEQKSHKVGENDDNIYLTQKCLHQNDSCINMGSDENHFNVPLILRDTVTRKCPQITTVEEPAKESQSRGIEPRALPAAYQPNNSLPLGQTGSQMMVAANKCTI